MKLLVKYYNANILEKYQHFLQVSTDTISCFDYIEFVIDIAVFSGSYWLN